MLEAINASREALEHNIESVVIDINLLRADQRKVAERGKINETLSDLKPAVVSNNDRKGLSDRMDLWI